LSGAELGITHRIPIDLWLLRAMGSIEEQSPGSLKKYYAIEDGFAKWAASKNLDPFVAMATVWNGIQDIAGVMPSLSYREGAKVMGLPKNLQHPENQRYVLDNLTTMSERLGKSRNQPPRPDIELPPAPQVEVKEGDLEAFKQQVRERMLQSRLAGDILGKKPNPAKPKIARRG
jgi:hypothetical protein